MTQGSSTSVLEALDWEVRWWQPEHPNAVPWLLGKLIGNSNPSTTIAADHSSELSRPTNNCIGVYVAALAQVLGPRQQQWKTNRAWKLELPDEDQLSQCAHRIIKAPRQVGDQPCWQPPFNYSFNGYFIPRADVNFPYFLIIFEKHRISGGEPNSVRNGRREIFCLISRHQAQVLGWSLHRWAALASWETVRCRWLIDKIAYAQTMSGGWACVRNVSEALRWAGILMKLGQLLGDRSTVRKCRVFVGYGYLWNGERERARAIFQAEQVQAEVEGDQHQIQRCIAALHHLNSNPAYSPETLAKLRGSDTVEEIWNSVFAASNAKQNVVAVSVPGVAPDHLR
jgi:hypothetical protein